MNIFPLVLQIAALACFFFEAFRLFQGPTPRPVWGWFGAFLALLSLMVSSIQLHQVS